MNATGCIYPNKRLVTFDLTPPVAVMQHTVQRGVTLGDLVSQIRDCVDFIMTDAVDAPVQVTAEQLGVLAR